MTKTEMPIHGEVVERLLPSDALEVDQERFWSSLEAASAVRLIATFTGLVTCYEDESVNLAVERAIGGDFDHLPVLRRQDDAIIGLFNRREVQAGKVNRIVAEVLEPIGAENLIAADTPITSFIEGADRKRCRLVLEGTRVTGLVTLSDLQKLPVRSVLFSLIMHFELLLTKLLTRHYADDESLFEKMPDKDHRGSARRRWQRMQRGNMSIEPSFALSLQDKMNIVRASPIRGLDGPSEEFVKIIYRLRNKLAHVADYATTETDAGNAAAAVREIRRWVVILRNALEP